MKRMKWPSLRGFWKRKPKPDDDDLVFEKWTSRFSLMDKKRFRSRTEADYESRRSRGGFELLLKKKQLFAWAEDDYYRYSDFILRAECSFGAGNGYSALGFVFRKADSDNYYYFLLSNRGFFRFDLVFNGKPQPLLPWLPSGEFDPAQFTVELIARGNRYLFLLNGAWLGEVEDETVVTGGLAFAAQNYDEADRGRFFLNSISLESRPVEVEAGYTRWNSYLPVSPERRMVFARRLYETRQYILALVQLKKAFSHRAPAADDYLLFAGCCREARLWEEGLEACRRGLELDPARGDILQLRLEMLYLSNRFLDLKEALTANTGLWQENGMAWNLLGHAEYALGKWAPAAEAYGRAAEFSPEEPQILLNQGRASIKAGRIQEALDVYLRCGSLFLRQNRIEELRELTVLLEELDLGDWPDIKRRTEALKAKQLYFSGRREAAAPLLKSLAEELPEDSTLLFLCGEVAAEQGERREAEEYYRRALESADEARYHFRRADNLFRQGQDPLSSISRALALEPENPWFWALKGAWLLEQKEIGDAVLALERAVSHLPEAAPEAAPEGDDVRLLYARALLEREETQRGEEVLERIAAGIPEKEYLRGWLSELKGRPAEALEGYAAALDGEPAQEEYLAAAAELALREGEWARAEEFVRRGLDRRESPQILALMGRISLRKGEFTRALSAYQRAWESAGAEERRQGWPADYIRLLIRMGRSAEAWALREEAGGLSADLDRQLYRAVWDEYACSGCGRLWRVPRGLEAQGPLRLKGELSEESPAGVCPDCGALYCVGCGKSHLREGRFHCAACGGSLKLSADWMKYILKKNELNKGDGGG